MRVLHCLPGRMNHGGIEKVIMEIIEGMSSEISFGILAQEYIADEYQSRLKEHGVKQVLLPAKSKKFLSYKEGFIKAINDYDIVHIHAVYSFSYFEAKWASEFGKRVIVHSHNSNSNLKRKLVHLLLRRKLDALNDIERLAVSKYSGEWMYGKKSFNIIFNGMNLSRYTFSEKKRESFRTDFHFSDSEIVIGVVGRLDFQKDPLFSYKIISEVCKINKKYHAFFIGDGKYRNELIKRIKHEGLSDQIKMIRNSETIDFVLCGIDIFLLPSRYEGLSIASVEAQIAGLPCILSNKVDPSTAIVKNVSFLSKKDYSHWISTILNTSINIKNRKTSLDNFEKFSYHNFFNSIKRYYF